MPYDRGKHRTPDLTENQGTPHISPYKSRFNSNRLGPHSCDNLIETRTQLTDPFMEGTGSYGTDKPATENGIS